MLGQRGHGAISCLTAPTLRQLLLKVSDKFVQFLDALLLRYDDLQKVMITTITK